MMSSSRPGTGGPVRRTRAGVAAGLALILTPLLTAGVKLIVPGWMLAFYLYALWAIIGLYILVVVITATGFLSRRAAFGFTESGSIRARIAAWTHPLAFLVATAVLVDGGDDGTWTSPLAVLLGLPTNSMFADVTGYAFAPLLLISGIALVWLVVEWIFALRARRLARSLSRA